MEDQIPFAVDSGGWLLLENCAIPVVADSVSFYINLEGFYLIGMPPGSGSQFSCRTSIKTDYTTTSSSGATAVLSLGDLHHLESLTHPPSSNSSCSRSRSSSSVRTLDLGRVDGFELVLDWGDTEVALLKITSGFPWPSPNGDYDDSSLDNLMHESWHTFRESFSCIAEITQDQLSVTSRSIRRIIECVRRHYGRVLL